jgi:hypothetical protein
MAALEQLGYNPYHMAKGKLPHQATKIKTRVYDTH